MTWQSLAAVLDRATLDEANDAARFAPIRTVTKRSMETLACPACDRHIAREALHTHFQAVHEASETHCSVRGCSFEAMTEPGLKAHIRYRHRREPR